ncbi:hypothetical protein PROPEN_01473 [Proteus penneri ATCC 35198]|nr:hypothetical protein PROPEN_01473 [Proteus penneri ATCC 35198]
MRENDVIKMHKRRSHFFICFNLCLSAFFFLIGDTCFWRCLWMNLAS